MLYDNNHVSLTGTVASDFVFSHTVYGIDFFVVSIKTKRLSGTVDSILILVSSKMINVSENLTGERIYVEGSLRTHDLKIGKHSKLIMNVFADIFIILDSPEEENTILLGGFLCKTPTVRITPSGMHIADLLLAVHRSYGRSDYIPCICWGGTAHLITHKHVGDYLKILGRLQSRWYQKGRMHLITYEVSIEHLESEGILS